jgi:regulator of nucleoside diphosphate kinase
MVLEKQIVTVADRTRLLEMIESLRSVGDPFRSHLRELIDAIDRSEVVSPTGVDADVVTMNSRVRARDMDTGRAETFTLVYHGDSGMFDSRLSVLTSMGIAALGARVGEVIEFSMRRGIRRLQIEEILYQPEAAGDLER